MRTADENRNMGKNSGRSSFRERVDAILQEQKTQNQAAGYEPVLDNRVTVVMPQEETASAKSGEEAALGNYLNR